MYWTPVAAPFDQAPFVWSWRLGSWCWLWLLNLFLPPTAGSVIRRAMSRTTPTPCSRNTVKTRQLSPSGAADAARPIQSGPRFPTISTERMHHHLRATPPAVARGQSLNCDGSHAFGNFLLHAALRRGAISGGLVAGMGGKSCNCKPGALPFCRAQVQSSARDIIAPNYNGSTGTNDGSAEGTDAEMEVSGEPKPNTTRRSRTKHAT